MVVAFSPAGGGRDHFRFGKPLEALPDLTKLLVRDPSDSWYNAGLPGVGDTLEEIAERIREEVDKLGARKVVTYGSSMGGYAAILFGCMLGAARAIALSPQTLLDPVLPHTPPADISARAPDLKPIIRRHPGTRVDLVVGWDELVDVFHAERVAELASVRVLGIRRGSHFVIEDLHRAGSLTPLIAELIAEGTPDLCEVDPPLEADVWKRIENAVFAGRRAEFETVIERLGPVAERYPTWAGPNFHYGSALTKAGNFNGAEIALKKAVRANPRWPQPRAALATVLCKRGRLEEAVRTIRDGLAVAPKWWRGHLVLGDCLLQLGREDDARSATSRAEELIRAGLRDHPTWAHGHLDLGRALLQRGRREEARSALLRAVKLNPQLKSAVDRLLDESVPS